MLMLWIIMSALRGITTVSPARASVSIPPVSPESVMPPLSVMEPALLPTNCRAMDQASETDTAPAGNGRKPQPTGEASADKLLQLLGRGEEPADPSARADPDAGRIVAVEGA